MTQRPAFNSSIKVQHPTLRARVMMARVPAPRLFLIDTYGFIFRAYHARARMQAPPMRTSTGLSTEVVYIFNSMLRKLAKTFKPE